MATRSSDFLKDPLAQTLVAGDLETVFLPAHGMLGASVRHKGVEVLRDNIKFLKEVDKTQVERPEPEWATRNKIILDLHTMNLRDFSTGTKGTYTLIVAPFAGHPSIMADFHKGQSLVENLLGNRIKRVCVTEWESATEAMKNYDIDMYLRELNTCVDDLGVVVNLASLCQGGWLSTMYAARFLKKVNALVLAGAPINKEV